MSSARQRAARASSHPAKGLSRLQPSPRAPAGATGRGSQPGRSPPGSHCAGAWSTQMTPQHGKPLAGRQEILILHPKSFPKQRNGLPGQRAEILTAKLKKTHTWRDCPKKQRGLGRDQRANAGGLPGFSVPWQGGGGKDECWARAGTLGGFQPKLLLLRPVMEHLGLSRRSRALVGGLQRQQRQLFQRLPAFGRKPCWWLLFCSAESDSFPSPPPHGGSVDRAAAGLGSVPASTAVA